MNVSLPPELAAAIEQRLEGVSRRDLAERARAFSDAYRAGGTSRGITEQHDVLAYLVARLPATYAAASAAFGHVAETLPAFVPRSILDVGAGPGAASWAAVTIWPSIAEVSLLDCSAPFLDAARGFAAAHPLLSQAAFIAGDLSQVSRQPKADLVVASYVLAERPEGEAGAIAHDLLAASNEAVVVVEPGTPAGFARVRLAREALIATGAHVVAPCTHDKPCPMQAPDWCHFSQRLPRSRDHMLLKDASVPFEDERYSYVAVSRTTVPASNRARIIAEPRESRAGLELPLCDDHGLHVANINRRDKAVFNLLKKARWGDVIVSED